MSFPIASGPQKTSHTETDGQMPLEQLSFLQATPVPGRPSGYCNCGHLCWLHGKAGHEHSSPVGRVGVGVRMLQHMHTWGGTHTHTCTAQDELLRCTRAGPTWPGAQFTPGCLEHTCVQGTDVHTDAYKTIAHCRAQGIHLWNDRLRHAHARMHTPGCRGRRCAGRCSPRRSGPPCRPRRTAGGGR